jgi:predicted secreted protein
MRAVLMALALAACAAPAENAAPQPAQEERMVSKPVPAPTPSTVTQRLTAADNGRTISVPVGGRFAVELVGVPTAGYVWQLDAKPAFLSEPTETSGNTTTAQAQPGFTGGNHWEVFVFAVSAAGEGTLKLGQRRPWEKTEPPSQTFSVTIKAQ